ncbi:MAG TPA: MerR family transcriptional regulator [Acidobacteriota bacterium]|nr:MerR family transcriptional regulator [Acidobacteriota bacterium]
MSTKKRLPTSHSIGVAVRRTGLKPDVIRAWEKRYGAIQPGRTPTNRRFYTDEQLERLKLLRQATLGGRQIGQVAGLSTEQLRELVEADRIASGQVPQPLQEGVSVILDSRLSACLTAVEKLDPRELRFHLERAATDLTHPRLLEDLLAPLLGKMGELWEKGAIRVVHEHVASAVMRSFLGTLQDAFVGTDSAPSIVIGTPLRQEHELGALIASAIAASEGWNVTHLGCGLPAEEIAAAANSRGVTAVALSLVYPTDDPYLASELKKLRRLLGEEFSLIVGGRAAQGYAKILSSISATLVSDLAEFREELRSARR